MIKYKIASPKPRTHFIALEGRFPVNGEESIVLHLAAWRPGRYELGNFAKNIRNFMARDSTGNLLNYKKINKDSWKIDCGEKQDVIISYEYYANELNAGSTYSDGEQLYINPVNCIFYNDSVSPYEIELIVPNNYVIAGGLPIKNKHTLLAKNFDDLADCPFVASASLTHWEYSCEGIPFHIWVQGTVKLDKLRLLSSFEAFTKAQFEIFGTIPAEEYHFILQFTQVFQRHGVEHHNSTVIAMGPAADFQSDHLFKDLLGISCHELFHTWNVKSIRPKEMMPYDYSQENYSTLGYVTEGITTYYGDLLLWRTKLISDIEWYGMVQERVENHMNNSGRFSMSVAESSFDTWLDGYSTGIPGRKVSIYNEGFLIAMMCDLEILANSSGKKSMDDVMLRMYEDFGKTGIGYTDADFRNIAEEINGASLTHLFEQFIFGKEDYYPYLEKLLLLAGMDLRIGYSSKWTEANLGLFTEETAQKVTVHYAKENSPAENAGLTSGDEIVAVNNIAPYKNFQSLMRMNDGHAELIIQSKNKLNTVTIKPDGHMHAFTFEVEIAEGRNAEQNLIWQSWKSRRD